MIVTMDVYSGRPNPTWTLGERDKAALISRVAGKAVAAADEGPGHLGFRGYIVSTATDDDDTATAAGLPDVFRVGASAIGGIAVPAEGDVEALSVDEADDASLWLLETAVGAVDVDVLEYVSALVSRGSEEAAVEAEDLAQVAAACVIQNGAYNPAFWNAPNVQPYNNCYNYAMNYRSNTFAQPGRISNHPNSVMQCANVGTAANWDGCKTTCSGPNKNVALVIWPGQDYHWYRKHTNGFWGHKPGGTAARNVDSAGHVIGGARNPQNCARGPYTIFCGYRFSPVGMQVR